MDDRLLAEVVDYLESYTGLRSPPANAAQLRRTCVRQAENRGMSIERYAAQIRQDAVAREQLLNAVMIGETYFFREVAQFRLLRNHLLPELAEGRRTLTCWSVSCSTGEEAVSLAVLLDDFARTEGRGTEFRVFASDINSASLGRLRSGVFPRSSLRRDGAEYHALLLDRHVVVADERQITVSPQLLSRIQVQHLNFFRDSLQIVPDALDLLFFRNTLLYATAERRDAIVARIMQKVRIGGVLFFATSELPFVQNSQLRVLSRDKAYYMRRERGIAAGTAATPAPVAGSSGVDPAPVRPPVAQQVAANPTTEEILARLAGGEPTEEQMDGATPNAAAIAAGMVIDCFAAVNADQLDRAGSIADDLDALTGSSVLARYCAGWVHYVSGRASAAIAAFDTVLEADQQFWPARFYRAALSVDTLDAAGRRSRSVRREFERCLSAIEADERSDRGDRYAFLLEGFNAAYFRRMCARWIEKLSEQGDQAWR